MVTDSVSPNSQGPCFLTQLSPGAHQRWARPLPWGLAPSTAGLWTGRCGAWRCQPRRGESKAGSLLRPGLRHLLEARGRTGGVGRGVPGAPAWRRDKALSHSDRGQTLAPRSPARSHHPPGPSHSPLFTPASASRPVPAPFRIPARAPVRAERRGPGARAAGGSLEVAGLRRLEGRPGEGTACRVHEQSPGGWAGRKGAGQLESQGPKCSAKKLNLTSREPWQLGSQGRASPGV